MSEDLRPMNLVADRWFLKFAYGKSSVPASQFVTRFASYNSLTI